MPRYSNMSDSAQKSWEELYQKFKKQYDGDEEAAARVTWKVFKESHKKNKEGNWVKASTPAHIEGLKKLAKAMGLNALAEDLDESNYQKSFNLVIHQILNQRHKYDPITKTFTKNEAAVKMFEHIKKGVKELQVDKAHLDEMEKRSDEAHEKRLQQGYKAVASSITLELQAKVDELIEKSGESADRNLIVEMVRFLLDDVQGVNISDLDCCMTAIEPYCTGCETEKEIACEVVHYAYHKPSSVQAIASKSDIPDSVIERLATHLSSHVNPMSSMTGWGDTILDLLEDEYGLETRIMAKIKSMLKEKSTEGEVPGWHEHGDAIYYGTKRQCELAMDSEGAIDIPSIIDNTHGYRPGEDYPSLHIEDVMEELAFTGEDSDPDSALEAMKNMLVESYDPVAYN